MIKDLVSVIIPCYNGAKYVEEALDSIIKQTYKFLEIIVIDDNSTDNTFDLLERIAKKDNRIRLFRNESNLKLINTLNRGIDLSNGEYIARMDQDDIAHSSRIEAEYNFLRNENFDVVSSGIKFFKKKIRRISKIYFPLVSKGKTFLWASFFVPPIIHPALFCKADVLKNNKYLYKENLVHVEDYELWHRLLLKGYRFGNINKVLLYYRADTQNTSVFAGEHQKNNFINQVQRQIIDYFKIECSVDSISVLCNRMNKDIRYADLKQALHIFWNLYRIYISRNNLDKKDRRIARRYNYRYLFSLAFQASKRKSGKDFFQVWVLFLQYIAIVLFLKSPLQTFYRLLPVR